MKKDAGLKSNFHTHTFRCGHAKGDIKDYTKSAISFGFKNIGFSDHAFFPGIHHEFMRGDFSLLDIAKLMSTAPAKILKINAGSLKTGALADIALVDVDKEWIVDRDKLHGKSKNTPFKGMKMKGKVVKTILEGKVVFEED